MGGTVLRLCGFQKSYNQVVVMAEYYCNILNATELHTCKWLKVSFALPTEIHIVKAMVFPVVMYGCESLTIKKAEYQRTDSF